MGCQRLHCGMVASRLSSNGRTGRIYSTENTGCRPSTGPADLKRGWTGGSRMSLRLHVRAFVLAFVVFAAPCADSYAMSRSKQVLALVPRPKPTGSRPKHILALVPRPSLTDPCVPAPVSTPFAVPPDALALASMNAMSADVPAIKQAIELVRKRKISQATEIEKSVRDPMAQKLIEWVILRFEDSDAGFDRYAAFIRDHPSWPSLGFLRRRAEGALWQERRHAVTVRRFIGEKPTSAQGRLALARTVLGEGDHSNAEREVGKRP